MKIVFTTTGTDWDAKIDSRFGRTDYLLSYDEEKDELNSFDNKAVNLVAHGAGPQTAQMLLHMNPDVLVTGNGPGGNAAGVLSQTGIKIYVGASGMSVKEAYDAYKNGHLQTF